MKIVIIGSNGTVGKHLSKLFKAQGHEVVGVNRSSGDIEMDMSNPACVAKNLKRVGRFDALAVASGEVAFAPLAELTRDQWMTSLQSKLLGQINLVQQALEFVNEGGSFTLITGVLGREFIRAGVAAATVNGALESFVRAAALEMPKGVRINAVSPTLLEDSLESYGPFFPGFTPVSGEKVAQTFSKAISGIATGTVFEV